MIDSGYEYGKAFQRRLLALLVRDPNSLSSIIRPQYFTHPLLIDISRVVTEAYEKQPDERLSQVTLRELVKGSLAHTRGGTGPSTRKRSNWLSLSGFQTHRYS